MRYSFAIAAAFIGAVTASPTHIPVVSQIEDGQPQAPYINPVTSSAAAIATPVEVYTTQVVTVTSCGSAVKSCPAASTVVSTVTYPENTSATISSTAAPTTYIVTSVESSSTSAVVVTSYPISSVSSSVAAVPATSAASYSLSSAAPSVIPSETPSTSSPVAVSVSSNNAALPATSAAAPSVSVITISTCVPTVIVSTVTVQSSSAAPTFFPGTPSQSSSAAPTFFPGTPSPTGVSGTGASGVGVSPIPTSSPITPFTGSASSFGASMALAGIGAVAVVLFA